DQSDRRGRPEVDLVIEFGEMLGIERGHHHAGKAAVAVQEAPRDLHRPAAAGASDHRLADEQLVVVAAEMNSVVVSVAQIQGGRRLRPGVRRAHDALGVDDADLQMISLSTSVVLTMVPRSVVSLRVSILRRRSRALSISPIERSTFSSNSMAKLLL